MDRSELNELMLAARKSAFQGQQVDVLAMIDAALQETNDSETRGELLLSRAVANQVDDDPGPSAADALAAVDAVHAGMSWGLRAAASAIAAGFVLRTGDMERSVDLAVDALAVLAEHEDEPSDHYVLRATNALSVLFSRLAAFELAVDSARSAWQAAAGETESNVRSIVAYNLCSCGLERLRASDCTEDEKSALVADINTAIEYLCNEADVEQAYRVVGPGMRAELSLLGYADRSATEALGLTDIDSMDLPPQVLAWHRLVRSLVARRDGDLTLACELIDDALTVLRLPGAEEHNLLRAMRQRAEVRQAMGDLQGASEDLLAMVERLHRAQREQVGRLSMQIRRRAEGEIARIKVGREAAVAAKEMAIDEITGVGTRRWLERRMEDMATTKAVGAVIMFDLDHFKAINDSFGHVAGDRVLARVGATLQGCLRHGDLVARYGGEEFVVFLPDTSVEAARQLGERIGSNLRSLDWSAIAEITVTISAGVAVGPFSNPWALVELADQRLYQAKRDGRDRVIAAPVSRSH